MFKDRHFDTYKKSWYIGEGQEAKDKIWDTLN